MDRRRFIQSGAALGILAGCASKPTDSAPIHPTTAPGIDPFQHGVASGDPLQDRVILWTRVSPADTAHDIDVTWFISSDAAGKVVVSKGSSVARSARDYTVKVEAAGLRPGQRYFYGFRALGANSPIGRTKTLPTGTVDQIAFAVTSCANYPQGFFNAYAAIAARADLDAVLNLGDYFYEYGNGGYGDGTTLGRIPQPVGEIITLSDYRLRHAQHKQEPDLQAAHAAHPWIVVWDDHESANNSWRDGAQNHNPEGNEGPWSARKAAAIQAYYEWMPIRELPSGLFRRFRIGDLVHLVMLDTRLEGRDEQGLGTDHVLASAPDRSILGPIQEQAFLQSLTQAQEEGAIWKLVGQQVVFTPLTDGKTSFNPDSWDGYRTSRANVLNHIERNDVSNVVVLSGDVHSSWGMEVPTINGSQAIELVAPAVSSPPLANSRSMQEMIENVRKVPHVKFVDGDYNGYLAVHLNRTRVRAEWHFTVERTQRSSQTHIGAVCECVAGTQKLELLS